MLQQLLEIVQESTKDSVVKNQKVPNQFNTGVQQEIAESITDFMKNQVASGNINGVVELLKKGSNTKSTKSDPIVGGIVKTLVSNLSKKFNISEDVAIAIAQQAIPLVISGLTKKAANKRDNSIDFSTILGELTKGSNKSGGLDIGSLAQTLIQVNSKKGGGDLFGSILGGFLKGK
ncbi:MAG: DUF937 domain-containing protein [Cytophagales bacterium]